MGEMWELERYPLPWCRRRQEPACLYFRRCGGSFGSCWCPMEMSCLSAHQRGLCLPLCLWLGQCWLLSLLPVVLALLGVPRLWPLSLWPPGIWGCLKSTASSSLLQGVDSGAMQRDAVRHCVIQYSGVVQHGAVRSCTVLRSAPRCSAV